MGASFVNDITLADFHLESRVRDALDAAVKGDCDFYDQLVGVIHHKECLSADDVALLVTCLRAVSGAVSSIDIIHHRNLLAAILGMSLWNYGVDVMDALACFLVSLASSNGEFVDLCLEMLVDNFMPPYTFHYRDLLKKPQGLANKDQVLALVHLTLKDIALIAPLSPLRIGNMVKNRMPNMYKDEPFLSMYVENMLRLESGAMGKLVGSTVLIALVDRLIDLDVELTWDDILQDDFCKGIFDMELEDFEGCIDDTVQDGEMTREALVQMFFCGNLVAEKLDSLMVLTFEHLQSCFRSGRLSQVFETLLQSFKKTILTAYKSKFAQFVMFYACSLDPENCGELFATSVLDVFLTSGKSELRMSCAAYLASYLARAKFLSASFVATILESLVNWCFDYCKGHEGSFYPKGHSVFYAACQAIMYVLCFRMKQVLSVPRINSRRLLKHIEDILAHSLKPMQVCLPSIVEEFVQMVKKNSSFLALETFVGDGRMDSENSRAFGGVQRLDMFFPFDPCLLKKSDNHIRPNYVYWSMVRSSYEDDDNDEEMSEEEEEEDDVYGGGMSFPDEFECSLDKMSITPKPGNMLQMPSRLRPSTSPESL